ncbi:hypothetical protein A6R68_01544, partial [Neotoma lepida]
QCGTKTFDTPELGLGEGYDGKKADVCSVGVLLYFITTRQHPLRGRTQEEILVKIIKGTYDFPAQVPGQFENHLHQMLTIAPERRPSMEDVQQHLWVMKFKENIPSATYPDPNIGTRADEIYGEMRRQEIEECTGDGGGAGAGFTGLPEVVQPNSSPLRAWSSKIRIEKLKPEQNC